MENPAKTMNQLLGDLDDLRKKLITYTETRKTDDGLDLFVVGLHEVIESASDEINRRQEQFRLLDEFGSDYIWQCNLDGHIVYAAPSTKKIFGFEPEEHTKPHYINFFPPDEIEHVNAVFDKAKNGVRYQINEFNAIKKDGTSITVEIIITPLYRGDRIVGIQGITKDISKQVKIQEDLRISQGWLMESERAAGIGHYVMNFETAMWTSSPTLDTIFGIDENYPHDLDGIVKIIHPDQRREFIEQFRKSVFEDHQDSEKEYRIVRINDNATRWVRILVNLVFSGDGKPSHLYGTVQDITEHISTLEALAKEAMFNAQITQLSEQMLGAKSIKELASITLETARILTGSDFGLIGYVEPDTQEFICPAISFGTWGAHQELIDEAVFEKPPRLHERGMLNRETILSNDLKNDPRFSGFPGQHPNIRQFLAVPTYHEDLIVQISVANSEHDYNDEDQVIVERIAKLFILGLLQQLNQIKINEKLSELTVMQEVSAAMRQANTQEELIKTTIEEVSRIYPNDTIAAIALYDDAFKQVTYQDGTESWFNWKDRDILLYSKEVQMILQSGKCRIFKMVPEDYGYPPIEYIKDIKYGAVVPLATENQILGVLLVGITDSFTDSDSDLLVALSNMAAAAINRQRLYQNLEHQIKTLKETQAKLIRSEKLAAIGELTAGVAHELNNPLTSILLMSEVIQDSDNRGEKLKKDLEKIGSEARRSANIVRGLLNLSRQRVPEKQPIHINDIILASIDLVGYELKTHSVEWSINFAPDLPITMADPYQLQQVFVNLLTNAWHAISSVSDKGEINISTTVISPTAQNPYIQIQIQDSGPGIPDELLERIFDPFFSTKPEGMGTGLGLSICYGIIDEHDGSIRVENSSDMGANFIIDLPIITPSRQNIVSNLRFMPDTEKKEHEGKILVIDDETTILEIVTRIIRKAGHQVESANAATTALEKLSKSSYDLILCDIHMPDMNGMRFYDVIKKQYPNYITKVIFTTGDSVSGQTRLFLDETRTPCLHKPYEKEELINLIDEKLGLN